MSYAEGRFAQKGNDDDDSFGEEDDFMFKANMNRRGGAMASRVQNQSDSEKEEEEVYEFPNIVNIGNLSYETRLE